MSLTPEYILEHGPFLRGLARSLLRDAARADDVVQEAWLAAMRRPAEVRDLRPWLVGVVRNLARRDKRTHARREAREQRAFSPAAERRPEDILETEEARRRMVDALLSLEEPYRTPLLLRYYDELPSREIAKRLDVPGSTVRTRIQRGLEQLRRKLDDDHGGDRRSWCLALVPLALGPRSAAVSTVATLLGAVSMKIKITVIAVAVAACAILFLEIGRAGAPAQARSVAERPVETRRPASRGTAPRVIVGEPVGERPSAPAKFLLRGVVRLDGATTAPAQVVVRGMSKDGGLTKDAVNQAVAVGAKFEVALDPLFEGGAPTGLRVSFTHADAHPEARDLVVRSDPETRAPVIGEVDITLRRVSLVLGGVRNPNGDPSAGVTLAAFPMDGSEPEEAATVDVVTGDDGSYELRVPGEGPHLIVAAARGYRPRSMRVEVALGQPVRLEPIVLTAGLAITGRMARTGGDALAKADVAAELRGDALNLAIPGSDFRLCYLAGRVEHREVWAATRADGTYRIGGLIPSEYEVSVKRLSNAHSGLTFGVSRSEYEVVLQAPATSVDFEVAIATLSVQVRAGGAALPKAKVTVTQHKRSELGAAHNSNWFSLDETGAATRNVSPGIEITVEVEASGMLTQKRELRAPATGGARELVFDMEPAHPAKLLVTLSALGERSPPIPPVLNFTLRPLPDGDVIFRTSSLADGIHVVDRIEAGRYHVTASSGRDDYFFPVAAEVTVQPDTEQRLTLHPRVGGRLHVLYTTKDGRTDRPAFVKLVLPDGTRSKGLMIVKDDGSGNTSWTDSLPDIKGKGRIRRVLEPGVYRVIVQPFDEDKAERSTEVRIEAGKTVVAKLRE